MKIVHVPIIPEAAKPDIRLSEPPSGHPAGESRQPSGGPLPLSPVPDKTLEEFKIKTLTKLQELQEEIDRVKTEPAATVPEPQPSPMITTLTEEVAALKDRVSELSKTPAKAESDAPEPQHARMLSILMEEVSVLKNTVAELSKKLEQPKTIEIAAEPSSSTNLSSSVLPATQPPAGPPSRSGGSTPSSEHRAGVLDALAKPMPAAKQPEKKVAFFTKLWDHLNQTAFEIPLHKSNRKQ